MWGKVSVKRHKRGEARILPDLVNVKAASNHSMNSHTKAAAHATADMDGQGVLIPCRSSEPISRCRLG